MSLLLVSQATNTWNNFNELKLRTFHSVMVNDNDAERKNTFNTKIKMS